jgi:hypothetical protein
VNVWVEKSKFELWIVFTGSAKFVWLKRLKKSARTVNL